MSDEQQLVHLINQARSFKELKEDPRFQLLIDSVGTSIFLEWSNTDDGSQAKKLWDRIRALKTLTAQVDDIINEGVMAAEQLQGQKKAEKADFGSRPLTGPDIARKSMRADLNGG